VQGDYAQLAALAGTKSYSVQAKGCEFVGNSLNVTTTLAAQGDLALSVQLTDTGKRRVLGCACCMRPPPPGDTRVHLPCNPGPPVRAALPRLLLSEVPPTPG
jgi:hypothetical protein